VFTGIIQSMGAVLAAEPTTTGRRLVIRPDEGWDYRPALGDSVCVSGCCLTVAEVLLPDPAPGPTPPRSGKGDGGGGGWAFDLVPETLARTTLGELTPGRRVNLERSLAVGDLLGGHIVQGHVDGVAVVEAAESREGPWGAERRLTIRPTPTPQARLMEYIVPKGSIALDGVSLTIAAVADATFDVALIPTTLRLTTLGDARPGTRLNLEADTMAKTIVHYLRTFGGKV